MVRIVHFVVVYLCFSKGLARQEWSGGEVLAEVEWIGRSITGVVPDPESKNFFYILESEKTPAQAESSGVV